MVRIAHISDSHLGNALFQLTERREDARKCLKKAVEMAMRQSPDILVHTGDLFDSPNPSMEDITFAIELFRDIDEDVMKIVLQGNHDIPYGFRRELSPIRTLESAGLVVSTGTSDYVHLKEVFDGENVEINLASWTREYRLRKILNSAPIPDSTALFFSHNIPEDRDLLPVYFDYIGFGHSHNFWLDEEAGIGRPGSTCLVNWKKEMGGRKKLIVVDVSPSGNEYFVETLNDVREFKFITGLKITGMGPEEVENYIKKQVNNVATRKKKPIVIMEVEGTIDSETEHAIKRTDILQYGEKILNPLIFHIEPKWQSLGPRPFMLSDPLNPITSVQEYLEQTKESNRNEIVVILKELAG